VVRRSSPTKFNWFSYQRPGRRKQRKSPLLILRRLTEEGIRNRVFGNHERKGEKKWSGLNDCKMLSNDCKMHLNDCKMLSNDCKMSSNDCKIYLNDCKMSSNDCKMHSNDCKMYLNDCKRLLNDCKMSSNDCKMSSNDCKMSSNDCKMLSNDGEHSATRKFDPTGVTQKLRSERFQRCQV
jgi:hypothetical protein